MSTLFEVNCQPENDRRFIKNNVLHTNFGYECFCTLDAALAYCKDNSVGIGRFVGMRIEEQLFDDADEDAPHTVIATHNPYSLLGITETFFDEATL